MVGPGVVPRRNDFNNLDQTSISAIMGADGGKDVATQYEDFHDQKTQSGLLASGWVVRDREYRLPEGMSGKWYVQILAEAPATRM